MKTHRPRKRFGQNFLHDANVIERIVNSIQPQAGDRIVEIGPGEGALTALLIDAVSEMDVVELDRDLIPLLEMRFAAKGRLRIHQADALKFDFCALLASKQDSPDTRLRIAGNLPYNISTPLLFHLFEQSHCIADMHFMLQKEVVDRMVAAPGDNAYGRLSVMLQYYCQAEYLFTVKPGAFRPPPKVDSAIIRLIPHDTAPVELVDFQTFANLVNHCFTQRRKTLRNILKKQLGSETIEKLGIEPTIRPERLSLEEFARLTNAIAQPH